MVWVDYFIIGLIAISALIGLIRGFVREALSLIAWVVAIWVAITFAPLAAERLEPYISTPSVRLMAGFAALFVVTLIAISIINFLLAKLVDKTGIGGTDRLLGLLFGILRGGLLVALLVLLASITPFPQDPWWQDSQLIDKFREPALWIRDFLPPEVAEDFVLPGEGPGPNEGATAPAGPGATPEEGAKEPAKPAADESENGANSRAL